MTLPRATACVSCEDLTPAERALGAAFRARATSFLRRPIDGLARRHMVRPLRIQFRNAVYHVTSRGNLRAAIVCDDLDRRLLLAGLELVARRRRWAVLAFVIMDNHFHVFLRTPAGDLSAGM